MIRLLRHRAGAVHWNWGYVLSVPIAALVVFTQGGEDPVRAQHAAVLVVLLGLPWIVPAFIVTAVLSSPVYAWLHTLGPTPDVMSWLGGTVLVGAVIGTHVNAALVGSWLTRARPKADTGLGEFLRRHRNGAAH